MVHPAERIVRSDALAPEPRHRLTDAAKDALAEEGYDSEFGARPLKRALQKQVQNPIAEAILSGRLTRGQRAMVDVAEGMFLVRAVPSDTAEHSESEAVGV